jgi:hypothetical protein
MFVRTTICLFTSVSQTTYAVAPGTGVQRSRPGVAGVTGVGMSGQRMLKPKAVLQGLVPLRVTART